MASRFSQYSSILKHSFSGMGAYKYIIVLAVPLIGVHQLMKRTGFIEKMERENYEREVQFNLLKSRVLGEMGVRVNVIEKQAPSPIEPRSKPKKADSDRKSALDLRTSNTEEPDILGRGKPAF